MPYYPNNKIESNNTLIFIIISITCAPNFNFYPFLYLMKAIKEFHFSLKMLCAFTIVQSCLLHNIF